MASVGRETSSAGGRGDTTLSDDSSPALCIFREHRRALSFPVGASLEEMKRSVKSSFKDVLKLDDDFFIQIRLESGEWAGEFVDITETTTIPNHSTLKVIVQGHTEKDMNPFKRASKSSILLAKPSESEVEKLSKLFPSIGKRTSSPSFDPNRSRKPVKVPKLVRPTRVTVCKLPTLSHFVPRGRARSKLKEEGRIIDLSLTKDMTGDNVKNEITHAFNSEQWTYLNVKQDNSLSISDQQLPDGNEVCSKRGCIYILDSAEDVSEDKISDEDNKDNDVVVIEDKSDDESLPPLPPSIFKSRSTNLELSQSPSSVPLLDPVATTSSQPFNFYEDTTSIIEEQNEEYEASLRIDKAKENERNMKIRRKQAIKDLKDQLKPKFASLSSSPPICFRFHDGSRIQHSFSNSNTYIDLYQFIVTTDGVCDSFTLFLSYPRRKVLPTDELLTEDIHGGVIFVEERDDSPDIIEICSSTCANASNSDVVINAISDDEKVTIKEAESKRKSYAYSVMHLGSCHYISRDNIFQDVYELYQNLEVANEHPFRAEFVGEKARDYGGVSKDMFSGFYLTAYSKYFDGTSLLQPCVNVGTDIEAFRVLGRVFSHAYICAGVLPDQLAFPCLAAAFLGPRVVIPESLLKRYYMYSLSTYEAGILENAVTLNQFSSELEQELISILGCTELPRPSNLQCLIVKAADFAFLKKPLAALIELNAGVRDCHNSFWCDVTLDELHSIYSAIAVTHGKVLSLLVEPEFQTKGQELSWTYLRKFIGNCSGDDLRYFLRFATGSYVITVSHITVTFNTLHGLARRPIAHTCSATLDLSSTFSTYVEFSQEFRAILNSMSSDSDALKMDAI